MDTETAPQPTATSDGRRRRRRPSARVWASVGAAVLVVASAAVWLARPGGLELGASTQSVPRSQVGVPITAGRSVSQEVVATQDDLAGVSVVFATYLGATDCALRATVKAPDGSVLSDRVVPCADLYDSTRASVVAQFPPVPDSAGQTYTLRLEPAPGRWSQAVSVWEGAVPGLPTVVVDGAPSDRTAAVMAVYDAGSVPHQMVTAARLASLGGPWWVQPGALVAWALVLVVALVCAIAFSWTSMRIATVLVVVVALARGLLWAAVLPPLEGMDEGAHVAYAQFLAVEGRIPVAGRHYDDLDNTYSLQLDELTTYDRMNGAPPGDRADHTRAAVDELDAELRRASPRADGAGAAAGYSPAYYAPAALVYAATPGTLADKVQAMRLWSVALGGLAAWAGVCVMRRLFPGRATVAVTLGLAVVLQPMMAHQFAIVNSDALVIAAGIAAFAAALRLATGGVRARHVLLAGALLGAALLAKQFGGGVAPALLLGWLIGLVRDRPGWRGAVRQAAAGVAGVLVTYGLWLAAQVIWSIPSTSLPVGAGGDPDRGPRNYFHLQFAGGMEPFRARWAEQLFGYFSWVDIRLPDTAYDIVWWTEWFVLGLGALWLVAGAGRWVWRRVARWRGRRPGDGADAAAEPAGIDPAAAGSGVGTAAAAAASGAADAKGPEPLGNGQRTWLSVVDVLGLLALLYAAGYLYFRSNGVDVLLQGRYALMALAALLALPALFLEGLAPPTARRWRTVSVSVTAAVLLVAMWTLQLVSIAVVADRFYL